MTRITLPAVLVASLVLLTTATPGHAAGQPSFVPSENGFHSVLAYGQGQTTSVTDLAQAEALGTVPASFTSQAGLYNAVVTKQPGSDADLASYYKNSGFSIPTDGTSETVGTATVLRDAAYAVPHIYAPDRAGAMYAVGYATAEDRLFLMDVLRRTSEGSTAELLGPSAVPSDSAAIGQFDQSPAQLTAEVMRLGTDEGAEGAQGLKDLQSYVDGINAYITAATTTSPQLLPAEYPALGAMPRAWTIADTASIAYLLIAQFTVAGNGEENQADILARLKAKLGDAKGQAAFDDLRNLENPETPTTTHTQFLSDHPVAGPAAGTATAANVTIDAKSITPRDAVTSTVSPSVPPVGTPVAGVTASSRARDEANWASALAQNGLLLPHQASNAILVAGSHTDTGHAIGSMGPQVEYYSPEILTEYEVHAPGVNVSGMSFPGSSPFPLIGHTTDFAWTGTTALGDNADTFAETLCNADGSAATAKSTSYLYQGTCTPFTTRDQVLHTPLNPTDPTTLPETVTLTAMNSVHGPVTGFATSGGKAVALVRSVGIVGNGIRSLVAFEMLAEGEVHSPQDFVAVMHHFTGNENWFYVSDNHIAWLASGWFQQRAPGTDVDLPINGDGTHDWLGFNPADGSFTRFPDSFNPTSVDPAQGYLVSWNNKAAPGWRASAGTWSFGRVQRVDLLEKPIQAFITSGMKISLAQAVGVSGNASTQDLRGVEVLPDLLTALGTPTDPTEAALVGDLKTWVAGGAHRRDTTAKGYDDDSAAVLAFDAWWRSAVHAVYDPQLGADVVSLLDTDEDFVLEERAVKSGFFDGWQSQLSSVVRASSGDKDAGAPTGTACGDGTLTSCRALLASSFTSAVAALKTSLGNDPTTWQKPVLCASEPTPTCDENRPLTAGAIATPSQPFENRGTFHQAVQLDGPLTIVGPGLLASPEPGTTGGGTLASTGGVRLASVLALALLGAAVAVRRRRRV